MVLGRRQIRGSGLAMMTFSHLLLVCLPVLAHRQTLSRQPRTRPTWGTEGGKKKRRLECTSRACRAGSVGCSRLRSSPSRRVPAARRGGMDSVEYEGAMFATNRHPYPLRPRHPSTQPARRRRTGSRATQRSIARAAQPPSMPPILVAWGALGARVVALTGAFFQ